MKSTLDEMPRIGFPQIIVTYVGIPIKTLLTFVKQQAAHITYTGNNRGC